MKRPYAAAYATKRKPSKDQVSDTSILSGFSSESSELNLMRIIATRSRANQSSIVTTTTTTTSPTSARQDEMDGFSQHDLMRIVAARSSGVGIDNSGNAPPVGKFRTVASSSSSRRGRDSTASSIQPHPSDEETWQHQQLQEEYPSEEVDLMKLVAQRASGATCDHVLEEGHTTLSASKLQRPANVETPAGAYHSAPGGSYRRTENVNYSNAMLGSMSLHNTTSSLHNNNPIAIQSPATSNSSNTTTERERSKRRLFGKTEASKQQCRRMALISLIPICLVVIPAVILIVIFLLRNGFFDSTEESSATNATGTTETPKGDMKAYIRSLFPEDTLKAIDIGHSPQAFAYRWLVKDPTLIKNEYYSDQRIRQRFAMATLYYATGGIRWNHNDNWLSYSIHECEWFSQRDDWVVSSTTTFAPCNNIDENVMTHLSLPNNELDGTLTPEIFWLTSLQMINIHNNRIRGSIPDELSVLTQLKVLDVSNNDLEGTIPWHHVLNTTTITSINFFGNPHLEGTPVPSELWRMSNQLTGLGLSNLDDEPFPSEATELTLLRSLSLSGLTGTIPRTLVLMTNLERLELSYSDLTGTIPTILGHLSNLQLLSFRQNILHGMIPSEIGKLSKLRYFFADGNRLQQQIPSELGSLSQMRELRLANNELTGDIPSEFGKLTGLTSIHLNGNRLSGEVPSELGLMRELVTFGLHDNELEGHIPSQLGDLSKLFQLYLDDNNLTGSLPSELGRLQQLDSLVLNGNGLTGQIPLQLERLPLQFLRLEDNSLTGIVPNALCSIGMLDFDCGSLLCGCDCVCSGE